MKIVLSGLMALAWIMSAVAAEASHRGGVDTSDLDDDPVAEVAIPVLFGVTLSDVIPDFGAPRGGGTRQHEGQDFIVPLGTPVVSPTEAVVLSTGTGASAGKFVYTANPGGEQFRYMHFDYIADLERGDTLDVGDLIGTVGDTGNAAPGDYHLHFETRDDDNQAQDPHERLVDDFTLKEKMSFLSGILRAVDDEDEYAEFLVSTFTADFVAAYNAEYRLPDEIEAALEATGALDQQTQVAQLETIMQSIPQLLTMELATGDEGAAVVLLQLYLMFTLDGTARDRLAAAGATGYYGSITSAAVGAAQLENNLTLTGRYDSEIRAAMLK